MVVLEILWLFIISLQCGKFVECQESTANHDYVTQQIFDFRADTDNKNSTDGDEPLKITRVNSKNLSGNIELESLGILTEITPTDEKTKNSFKDSETNAFLTTALGDGKVVEMEAFKRDGDVLIDNIEDDLSEEGYFTSNGVTYRNNAIGIHDTKEESINNMKQTPTSGNLFDMHLMTESKDNVKQPTDGTQSDTLGLMNDAKLPSGNVNSDTINKNVHFVVETDANENNFIENTNSKNHNIQSIPKKSNVNSVKSVNLEGERVNGNEGTRKNPLGIDVLSKLALTEGKGNATKFGNLFDWNENSGKERSIEVLEDDLIYNNVVDSDLEYVANPLISSSPSTTPDSHHDEIREIVSTPATRSTLQDIPESTYDDIEDVSSFLKLDHAFIKSIADTLSDAPSATDDIGIIEFPSFIGESGSGDGTMEPYIFDDDFLTTSDQVFSEITNRPAAGTFSIPQDESSLGNEEELMDFLTEFPTMEPTTILPNREMDETTMESMTILPNGEMDETTMQSALPTIKQLSGGSSTPYVIATDLDEDTTVRIEEVPTTHSSDTTYVTESLEDPVTIPLETATPKDDEKIGSFDFTQIPTEQIMETQTSHTLKKKLDLKEHTEIFTTSIPFHDFTLPPDNDLPSNDRSPKQMSEDSLNLSRGQGSFEQNDDLGENSTTEIIESQNDNPPNTQTEYQYDILTLPTESTIMMDISTFNIYNEDMISSTTNKINLESINNINSPKKKNEEGTTSDDRTTYISEEVTSSTEANILELSREIPVVAGNILNQTTHFSVNIMDHGSSFYIPSDAFLQDRITDSVLNITWKSSLEGQNNSLYLKIAKEMNNFMIKQVRLHILKDNDLHQYVQDVIIPSSNDETNGSSKSKLIKLDDEVVVHFSNTNFLRIISRGLTVSDSAPVLQKVEFAGGLFGICVILAAASYFVVRKIKRRRNRCKSDIPKYEP